MGDEIISPRNAEDPGLATVPGITAPVYVEEVIALARAVEYPVAIKAAHGDGAARAGPERLRMSGRADVRCWMA